MNQLGVDLGFYQVKVSAANFDIKYPSVIGYPSAIELQNDAASEKPEENMILNYENFTYYIGEKAIRDTATSQLTFLADKTDSITDRLKYLSALGLALGHERQGVFKVVTGLPVDEFAGHDGLKDRLSSNMKGTFEFEMNGIKRKAIVMEVITIPQCAGAYYDHVVDLRGKIIRERVNPRTVCIDIGYRTTDVVTMASAKYSPKESFTIMTGVSDIHKEVRRQLIRSYKINKEMTEIDRIVRDKTIYVNGILVHLEDMIQEAARPYAEKIVSEIPLWIQNLSDIHQVILTGGGAHIMRDVVESALAKRSIPVFMIDDAEYSNSRGYLKYGLFMETNKEAAKR